MSENKIIQQLCCLNMTMRAQNPPVFSSRKMIMRTIKEKDTFSSRKTIQNLLDTLTLMDWNEEWYKVFDLSSELFPHKSNQIYQIIHLILH